MPSLWQTMAQFLFRLSLGVAAAMAVTSARKVTSGFFRVHLWMLLGVFTFASLVVHSFRPLWSPNASLLLALTVASAVACYVGSVGWLYEKAKFGKVMLALLCVLSLLCAALAGPNPVASAPSVVMSALGVADIVTGGLLMGTVTTAMLLGHWYLNTPTMEMAPLERLMTLIGAALAARAILCAGGLAMTLGAGPELRLSWWLFLTLRWLSGLAAPTVLSLMARQTLKIPNTQSATGILYAMLIVTFVGELTSQLMTSEGDYPL